MRVTYVMNHSIRDWQHKSLNVLCRCVMWPQLLLFFFSLWKSRFFKIHTAGMFCHLYVFLLMVSGVCVGGGEGGGEGAEWTAKVGKNITLHSAVKAHICLYVWHFYINLKFMKLSVFMKIILWACNHALKIIVDCHSALKVWNRVHELSSSFLKQISTHLLKLCRCVLKQWFPTHHYYYHRNSRTTRVGDWQEWVTNAGNRLLVKQILWQALLPVTADDVSSFTFIHMLHWIFAAVTKMPMLTKISSTWLLTALIWNGQK